MTRVGCLRGDAMNRIAVGLASLVLFSGCTAAAASPSAGVTSPSPSSSPTAAPTVSPSAAPSAPPPSAPPRAAADCPTEVTASALVALDPKARIDCYGSTTLVLGPAVILPAVGIEIDGVPIEVPRRFEQVNDPKYGLLFLVDDGMDFDLQTSLPLYVADPSMHLHVFRGSEVGTSPAPSLRAGGASITGHFDDPASAQCRRPAGNDWLDVTDEDAILLCGGMFIVTSVETLG
jgi:hypothetical protein